MHVDKVSKIVGPWSSTVCRRRSLAGTTSIPSLFTPLRPVSCKFDRFGDADGAGLVGFCCQVTACEWDGVNLENCCKDTKRFVCLICRVVALALSTDGCGRTRLATKNEESWSS